MATEHLAMLGIPYDHATLMGILYKKRIKRRLTLGAAGLQ
jgi:hypothetical protein